MNTSNIIQGRIHSTMKSLTGLLGGFLLICYFQQASLAAPSHIKRNQEYVNALFDVYSCRVMKAANLVVSKLINVSRNCLDVTMSCKIHN